MASKFFLQEEKLIWIIQEPYLKVCWKSPIFNLLDINWSFEYRLSFYHSVYLRKESKRIPKKSFKITVSAEYNEVKNLTFSKSGARIYGIDEYKFTDVCCWKKSSLEMIKDRTKEVLKLTFQFDGITPKLQETQIKGTESCTTESQAELTCPLKSELQKQSGSCLDYLSEDMKVLPTDSSFFDLERFSEDMEVLLTDTSYSDVELKCENGSVKAHRNILSARSKVFASMLQSDMKEKQSGVVKIEDLDADVLKIFLHYIYTGTLSGLTIDVAYTLYDAGEKYALLGLKEICGVYLADNLSEDNACDLLVTADLHSDNKFKEKVIAYILEKKIPSKKDIWETFRKSHPDLASEVLTIAYDLQNQ